MTEETLLELEAKHAALVSAEEAGQAGEFHLVLEIMRRRTAFEMCARDAAMDLVAEVRRLKAELEQIDTQLKSLVPSNANKPPCPECDGTGYSVVGASLRWACQRCEGTGKVAL